jgi:phospholipase C
MSETTRRTFFKALAAGTAAAALPASIERALAIEANDDSGSIADVKHIVFLMQENRAFDQYFGTLRGVRGFGDPRAVTLPSGKPVWFQPTGTGTDVLPFRPAANEPLGHIFPEDVAHDWDTSHDAWNNGNYDKWIPSKGARAVMYMNRGDIPFHYALADAFTVCDAYHCSLMGPTDPNRYHMWTGWVGNDGKGGGPVVDNAEAGYDWSTYPEKLQAAGITWKVYQDAGLGLTAAEFWGFTDNPYIGNFGDNALLYFHQYQNAQPGNPLADFGKTGTNIVKSGGLFDILRADVKNDTLPQVSWIVGPEAYTEHPNWATDYGAWYISQVLDALTSNPAVWASTVLFVTYDEAGGFFDHVVPATPPQSPDDGRTTVSIANEIFPGSALHEPGPYGLGTRVPMIVVSPWSKGGYVNSELFDHTSLIRFIETRFGARNPALIEQNITAWRRAMVGDLTSTLNFASPNAKPVALPDATGFVPSAGDIADGTRFPDFVPQVPATQTLAKQEPGIRRARALPYQPMVKGSVDTGAGTVTLTLGDNGRAGIAYQVRSQTIAGGPWKYAVTPRKSVTQTWTLGGGAGNAYDLTAYGPNGFLRAFAGSVAASATNLAVTDAADTEELGLRVIITNRGEAEVAVVVSDAYSGDKKHQKLKPGDSFSRTVETERSFGWYDVTVTVALDPQFSRQLAGHIENGRDSFSDPMLGL